MLNYVNKTEDKNYMIFSMDAKKKPDKIQHPFMIKTLNKVGIEGIYFNIMAIHDKHTASIIINAERLKVFPLR